MSKLGKSLIRALQDAEEKGLIDLSASDVTTIYKISKLQKSNISKINNRNRCRANSKATKH